MSHPEVPQPEAQIAPPLEQPIESAREESPGLTQREFLKKLVGSAAGLTGLAAAGTLLTPKTAEAAYTPGGSPYLYLPGDQITTNVLVNGSAAIRGPRPWLDVTAFGASGDWSTAADAAVAAALASTPGGCILYFPPGIYAFTAPINIADRHITVMGAGRSVTYFYFYPGAGFNFTMTSPAKVTIRDIHFQCGGGHNPHPAIRIDSGAWQGPPGPLLAPHIHDVLIDAVEGSSWAKGIELKGVTGARIHDFQILGGGIANSTHGIHLCRTLTFTQHGSTISSITDGYIFGTQVGIAASDPMTEGLYIRAIEVLDANIGYLLDAPAPGTAISDSHAATTVAGIRIVDHGDMALVGNLLYGGPAGYVGIDCEGSGTPNPDFGAHHLRIIGNKINFPGNGTGIRLRGYASDGVIQGNIVDNLSAGAANGVMLGDPSWGTNVVTNNVVTGNRLKNVPAPTKITGTMVGSNWTTPNY